MSLNKRECGSCTKCCDGWLSGPKYGYHVYPGKPCHFLKNKKCSIHFARPTSCSTYNCLWLIDETVPENFKPEHTNTILTLRNENNFKYIEAKSAGGNMPVQMLNWLFTLMQKKKINIYFQINDEWNWWGTDDFVKYMNSFK